MPAHGPQKHSEKLSRTVQTINTVIAKRTLVVSDLLRRSETPGEVIFVNDRYSSLRVI